MIVFFCDRSSGYNDELAWGAAWLYRATGEVAHLNRALEFASTTDVAWSYDWDSKIVGAQVTGVPQITFGF